MLAPGVVDFKLQGSDAFLKTAFRHDAIKDGDPVKGKVLFRACL